MQTLFIGGAPRSGTTLLQEIICSSGQTNPRLGEAKYLKALAQAFQMGITTFPGGTEYLFDSEADFLTFNQDIFQRFFSQEQQKYPQASWLVYKDPYFSAYVNELMRLVPHSRMLVMIRDPRDVIASQLRIGQKMLANNQDPRYYRAETLPHMLQEYLICYLPLLHLLKKEGYHQRFRFIKYEHLVSDIQGGLTYLSEWLGLDLSNYHPDRPWLDYQPEKRADYDRPFDSDLYGQPLSNQRVGTYTQVLTQAQIDTIEVRCQDIFKVFSYPRSTPPDQ